MDIVTQLSVFLENKPGALARMCRALEEEGVNILGLTISDTVDHAVIRMVVSEPTKALHLLEQRNVLVVENEVLMMENDNRPGGLAEVAEKLARSRVNIEYAYLANGPRSKKGILIMRPSNVRKALEVLSALD